VTKNRLRVEREPQQVYSPFEFTFLCLVLKRTSERKTQNGQKTNFTGSGRPIIHEIIVQEMAGYVAAPQMVKPSEGRNFTIRFCGLQIHHGTVSSLPPSRLPYYRIILKLRMPF
jgi:hypothetical protein